MSNPADRTTGSFVSDQVQKYRAAQAAAERQPDAWAVFAEVRGQMVMQWPPRLTQADAERDAEFYLPGTVTDVRPLYAGPPVSQQTAMPRGVKTDSEGAA